MNSSKENIRRVKIQKENLTIRSAVSEDAVRLTDWWNDGEVMAHAGFPKGLGQTVSETLEQIKENETHLSQLCILETDGNPVGEIYFRLHGEGIAEIGIKICDVKYQDHGNGTKFLKMLLSYLFEEAEWKGEYPVEKICFDTNPANKHACHVYEKLGFVCTGVHPHSWKDQLGQWQDSISYEMTYQKYKDGVI